MSTLLRPGMEDRITYKTLTNKVRVLRNGMHVGDIRYFAQGPGWAYVGTTAGPLCSDLFSDIPRVKDHLEGRTSS